MKIISILMSVYKPEWEFIAETFESIRNQTFKEFEIVIVNDGCDNEHLESLLKSYDLPYKLIINPVNMGLPKSLNRGLKVCEGRYIARIDDDDCMEPDRLEKQYLWMEKHTEAVSVFSNYRVVDKDGNTISVDETDHNKDLKRRLLYAGNSLCHSTLFARREVLEKLSGYDEKMTYAQDYDLYLRLIKEGEIYEIPQMLVRFRSVPERISINKHLLSALFSYYATLKYLSKNSNARIFWSRTIRTVFGVIKVIK